MKYLTTNKHWRLNEDYNLDKLLYLLTDRPDGNGSISIIYNLWKNSKGQWHRDYDLPSYTSYLNLNWCKRDRLHREKGKPAYIDSDCYKQYLENGEKTKKRVIKWII